MYERYWKISLTYLLKTGGYILLFDEKSPFQGIYRSEVSYLYSNDTFFLCFPQEILCLRGFVSLFHAQSIFIGIRQKLNFSPVCGVHFS